MGLGRRRPGAWLTLAGVFLAVSLFAGYLFLRPPDAARSRTELIAFVGILVAAVAMLAFRAAGLVWHRSLRRLTDRVATLPTDPASLDLGTLPRDLIPLARQVEVFAGHARDTMDRYRKTVEILQKEQQLAEITLQSMLGKADSEEGQSHSLVLRRGSGGLGDSGTSSPVREMIARLSPTFHWLAATPALQKFLGFTIVELNNHSFLEVIHREDADKVRDAFERSLRAGEGHNIECRIVLRGNTERNITIDVLTRYTPEGKPLHLRCHFVDISERILSDRELRNRTEQLSQTNEQLKRTNRDLERLKESYRDLYHNAPVLYFSLDPRGRIAAANETMLKALGFTREDLHDQHYSRLLTPESRHRYEKMPEAFQNPGEIEGQWIKKDGTVIDVWIRTAPVLDSEGRFIRSRSAAQDVTERKGLDQALRAQAEELQRTNEQLRRTNRELDDFTYVVSHDLKEPLRTLQAFSNFLAEDYGKQLGTEGEEYIGHLIQASKRLGMLIDDLLTLSRAGRILNTPQVFDMNETLNTVRGDLANLLQRKNATLIVEGPLPTVVGDPQRVAQLLTNLIGNGLKYNTNAQPEVTVTAQTREQMNGKKPLLPEDAGRIIISVRDNGIGIDPRYHEQIFGIFRRLHLPEEYEGTGAGLAISKKIVEAHAGRIWVESQTGEGATFYFTLASPTSLRTEPKSTMGRPTMVAFVSK